MCNEKKKKLKDLDEISNEELFKEFRDSGEPNFIRFLNKRELTISKYYDKVNEEKEIK